MIDRFVSERNSNRKLQIGNLMSHVLLIQPPIRDFYLTAKRTIPYGLSCIAGSLRKHGFTVDILDALAVSKSRMLDWPEEMDFLSPFYGREDISPFALFHRFRHYGYSFAHLRQQVQKSGAFLVGISSLFTAYAGEALETAKIVKEADPHCTVVLGGHHPTALPEPVLGCEYVDFVLRGEGEVTMPLLASAIAQGLSGQALQSIPGIGFRQTNGTLFINPPAVAGCLDDFPQPASDLVKNNFYRRKAKGSMVITASRGCPMTCSYCSFGSGALIPYRRRNISSIIYEMENSIQHHDVGFVDFEDENLSLDKSWFMGLLYEITQKFKGLNLELRAMNGLFPGALDEEIIAAMKQAGFKTLNLSVGSVNQTQLKRFLRPDVSRSFAQALDWGEKYGMDAVGYIIAGAPDQDPEDSVDDLLYLADKHTLAGLSVFYPSPGSLDYEKCRKKGLLPRNSMLFRSSAIPISHVTTRTDAVTLLRLSRILNFMKFLVDEGEKPPIPEKCAVKTQDVDHRKQAGMQLLKDFLRDGRIRGLTPDGVIYDHAVSMGLTERFLKNLDVKKVRGGGTKTLH